MIIQFPKNLINPLTSIIYLLMTLSPSRLYLNKEKELAINTVNNIKFQERIETIPFSIIIEI